MTFSTMLVASSDTRPTGDLGSGHAWNYYNHLYIESPSLAKTLYCTVACRQLQLPSESQFHFQRLWQLEANRTASQACWRPFWASALMLEKLRWEPAGVQRSQAALLQFNLGRVVFYC